MARDLPAVSTPSSSPRSAPASCVCARRSIGFEGASTLTLRFSEHKLHVRSIGEMLLCVLTGAKVNAPALRMAINLVARRVQGEVDAQVGNALFDAVTPLPSARLSTPPPLRRQAGADEPRIAARHPVSRSSTRLTRYFSVTRGRVEMRGGASLATGSPSTSLE